MSNTVYTKKLKWINQDEFVEHFQKLKETYGSDSKFETEFCFKFSDGSEWNCKFLFNQEGGFYLSSN